MRGGGEANGGGPPAKRVCGGGALCHHCEERSNPEPPRCGQPAYPETASTRPLDRFVPRDDGWGGVSFPTVDRRLVLSRDDGAEFGYQDPYPGNGLAADRSPGQFCFPFEVSRMIARPRSRASTLGPSMGAPGGTQTRFSQASQYVAVIFKPAPAQRRPGDVAGGVLAEQRLWFLRSHEGSRPQSSKRRRAKAIQNSRRDIYGNRDWAPDEFGFFYADASVSARRKSRASSRVRPISDLHTSIGEHFDDLVDYIRHWLDDVEDAAKVFQLLFPRKTAGNDCRE